MVVNPAGYVPIADGGDPGIITGKAIEGVLPGYIVAWSGASQGVSSGTNSYASSDLWVHVLGSGLQVAGVSIGSAASGGYVGVQTRGSVILTAEGTVTNSTVVGTDGDHAVLTVTADGTIIGRAVTNSGSEGYCIVNLTGL